MTVSRNGSLGLGSVARGSGVRRFFFNLAKNFAKTRAIELHVS